MTAAEQAERARVVSKLRESYTSGKMTAQTASNMLSRNNVYLILEKVELLLEAGLPERLAKEYGGQFDA
ncbi:MAG: hypothetical protein JNJ83_11090 [Verrucomicrobiaceae bacterium]|nr:hypothetical protein [Verrucomicrobiaceae bacterium]